MPNSWVRCETVIENVLKIRKPPTNSAIPAKTSSAIVMNEKPSLMSWDSAAAVSSPVRTVTDGGSACCTRCLSCSGETPGPRRDQDLVELALLVGQALGLLERELRDARAAELGLRLRTLRCRRSGRP